MPWVLDSSTQIDPSTGEGWRIVPIAFRNDARAYCFRVAHATPIPQSWQRVGFFTFAQKLEGVWLRAASLPMFSEAAISELNLQHISPADSFVLSDPNQEYAMFVSPHRWIPAFTLQLWILTL